MNRRNTPNDSFTENILGKAVSDAKIEEIHQRLLDPVNKHLSPDQQRMLRAEIDAEEAESRLIANRQKRYAEMSNMMYGSNCRDINHAYLELLQVFGEDTLARAQSYLGQTPHEL